MKERPILFSGPMVRAILDGSKTQTRRVVKPQPKHPRVHEFKNPLTSELVWGYPIPTDSIVTKIDGFTCPYGKAGDRLWVRETFSWNGDGFSIRDLEFLRSEQPVNLIYRADGVLAGGWKPSIYMPRWASRLTLEITDVRVQRLQDIDHDDAMAEGCFNTGAGFSFDMVKLGESDHAETAFAHLWDSINGKAHPWNSNPWVWAIIFKVVPQ